MKRTIILNNNNINYSLILKDKKNISIKIDNNGDLIIYAPIGISYKYIENVLTKKQKWIISNINKIKSSYINNEDKIIFLGNEYFPKIEISNSESISIDGKFIIIKANNLNFDYVNALLVNWYKEQSKTIVIQRVDELARKYCLVPSKIIIKNQKSRWGSCNSKKEIRLNWRLILMPYYVMDYIIIHELCHLEHMNHSKGFWGLVKSYNPNYRKSEKWLKDNGISILKIN